MYTYRIDSIKRVIDGDTLEVVLDLGFNIKMTEIIRLEGVDTPEVFGKNAGEAGSAASIFTKEWVDKYKNDELVLISLKYNSHEKYGRVLGRIVNTSHMLIIDLTEDLIAAGHVKK